jgi:hypothetical protein
MPAGKGAGELGDGGVREKRSRGAPNLFGPYREIRSNLKAEGSSKTPVR